MSRVGSQLGDLLTPKLIVSSKCHHRSRRRLSPAQRRSPYVSGKYRGAPATCSASAAVAAQIPRGHIVRVCRSLRQTPYFSLTRRSTTPMLGTYPAATLQICNTSRAVRSGHPLPKGITGKRMKGSRPSPNTVKTGNPKIRNWLVAAEVALQLDLQWVQHLPAYGGDAWTKTGFVLRPGLAWK